MSSSFWRGARARATLINAFVQIETYSFSFSPFLARCCRDGEQLADDMRSFEDCVGATGWILIEILFITRLLRARFK